MESAFYAIVALLLSGAEALVKLPARALDTAKKLSAHVLDLNMADAIISELEKRITI
jgi:DNA polymerase-3 subunit delta'